ncbi:hypothetical protein ACFOEY_20180 [Paracandidimonas soli]|uniref:hypothetical protein n=1 Tax=Paracandidimonas soli TaxID=1917182 RepID=UPI00361780C8
MLISNWGAISSWLSGLWELIKGDTLALWGLLKDVFFSWSPLGLVAAQWEPIVAWFKDMWARVQRFIEPILNGVDAVRSVTSGISDAASSVAGTVADGAASAWGWVKGSLGFDEGTARAAPAAIPASAPMPAPASALPGREARLDGELRVRFDNAPPGMRVEPAEVDQPGLSVPTKVGYRSLGRE